jgi:hypothetical protein
MCGSRRFFWVWLPTYTVIARTPLKGARCDFETEGYLRGHHAATEEPVVAYLEHKCVHVLRDEYAPAAARRGRAVLLPSRNKRDPTTCVCVHVPAGRVAGTRTEPFHPF